MCDKLRNGTMAQKPKSAYELLMEKQRKNKALWFIDEKCPECGRDIVTDGKLEWCSEMCINDGKRRKNDKEGFGFISDCIR